MKRVRFQDNWPENWKLSYYHDLVEIYGEDNRCGHHYAYTNRFRHALDLIKKYIKPKAEILDIAAAQGNYSLSLAELGYAVTWNDIRSDLVDYVKLKYEYGTIHFAPGSIYECDFDHPFDLILIGEIIEHMAHPDRLLQRITPLLKKGGYILMTTPNGEYFRFNQIKFSGCHDPSIFERIQFKSDSDGHIFLLHLDEIYSFAQAADLSIIETRIINNPLTSGHLKLGLLLKFLPKRFVEISENFTQKLPLIIKRKIHNASIILFKSSQ